MYSQKLLDRRFSRVHNQPTLMPETAKPSSSIMHRLIDQTLKSVNIKRVSAISCVTIDSSDVLNIKSRRVKTCFQRNDVYWKSPHCVLCDKRGRNGQTCPSESNTEMPNRQRRNHTQDDAQCVCPNCGSALCLGNVQRNTNRAEQYVPCSA